MNGSILMRGSFIQPAAAVDQIIQLPAGVDFLNVYNFTQMTASAGANGGQFYWQRDMGTIGILTSVDGAQAMTAGITAANAFTLFNSSDTTPGAARAITNINATTGVILTATTAGLGIGSVIRLSVLSVAAAQQYGGIDFSVTAINPGVSFTIVPLTPSAAIGACTGFYRIVNGGLYNPRRRFISNITAAVGAVVTTTVDHGFSAGQLIRFSVPAVTATTFGMTQLDGISATVLVVNNSTSFTVETDTSAMGAFAWPAAASVPFTPAEVVPFGFDSETGVTSLVDAVDNTGFLGMILATGALLPGGVANDLVFWNAGTTSFSS